VEPTQLHIQLVLGKLSPWVQQVGNRADHSPPSSAEIKNEWYSTIPTFFLMMCAGATLRFTESNLSSFHCNCIAGHHFSQ